MEKMDLDQILDTQKILAEKIIFCKKLGVINDYRIMMNFSSLEDFDITMYINKFTDNEAGWHAYTRFAADPVLDEESYNALTSYLDEALKEELERVQAQARIINQYYGKEA